MAYRAHVRIGNGARMLGPQGIASAVAKTAPGHVRNTEYGTYVGPGFIGTRHGTPGIWIERDRRPDFVNAARALHETLMLAGLIGMFDATNAPTHATLLETFRANPTLLSRVGRG